MSQESYSGRYYRTCFGDIKSSEGWFGKLCLLGLINLIPVFGQMTLYGYSYEWGHQAAWGIKNPLPKKIYGRPGSKMLRWGWFALVISFVFALVPGIIQGIGSFMSAAGAATVVTSARGVMTMGGNPVLAGAGSIINFIGSIGVLAAWIFSLVAIIRMTMYDRLGTGFQLGKVWAMAKHDFGGLMRIFGMSLLVGLIIGLIIGAIALIILAIVMGATLAPVITGINMGTMSESAAVGYLVTASLTALPFILIIVYFGSVGTSFVQLLVGRAIGYWCQQFDVANWGTKDDPLPFEGAPSAQPAAPVYAAPQTPPAPAPAPAPTGSPVVVTTAAPAPEPEQPEAPRPATVEEALETLATDGMSVLEVEEIAEDSEEPSDK